MEQNDTKTQSLPYLIRMKLGVTRYRMAALLGRTPAGYTGMERRSLKFSLADIAKLKELGEYTWEEMGKLIEEQAKRND